MGQAFLVGPDHETTARALGALPPSIFVELGTSRQCYTVLLNDEGGIIDDTPFIPNRYYHKPRT